MMRYNREHVLWDDPYFHILYWMQWAGVAAVLVLIWSQTPWFPGR